MTSRFPDDPFTTSMAAAWGVSRKALCVAVDERRLVRLMFGLYVRADVPLTPLVRARAAGLVISDHAVVCDRTAAWIWGVDCIAYAELDGTPPLETYVLRRHRATAPPTGRRFGVGPVTCATATGCSSTGCG